MHLAKPFVQRRSALAERVRIRAEWAALKGPEAASDVLRGVVALVDVGPGSRALALRSALTALGATVVPNWVPLVTHVVWSSEGCRKVRARARALACQLVSPLWVEASAAAVRRLPEQAFPSVARPSDLPSPRTLRRMLNIADKENIPLELLSQDQVKGSQIKAPRLRISSENDTSRDTSKDTTTSLDRSDTTDSDPASRVNTAPRRVDTRTEGKSRKRTQEKKQLKGEETSRGAKSRRKLFTQKPEGADDSSCDEDETQLPRRTPKLAASARRDLARAERMARRLAHGTCSRGRASGRPRIVLTGMSNMDRCAIFDAIKKLNGRIYSQVTKKTTHVILGPCNDNAKIPSKNNYDNDITGIECLSLNSEVLVKNNSDKQIVKPRTFKALEGAARGCWVLKPEWVTDSLAAGRWLHPFGYEVQYLRKLSQRARTERSALRRMRSEYGFDVFNGLDVHVAASISNEAKSLLRLCGATLHDLAPLVNEAAGTLHDHAPLVTVGGVQLHVKWVFDSIAAARVRNTRRYIVKNSGCNPDS